MTLEDVGHTHYGAKRQSLQHDNPRDVLRQIVADNPRGETEGYEEHRARMRPLVQERIKELGGEYEDAIYDYWTTNNYNAVYGRPPASPAERDAAKATRKDRVKEVKAAIIERVKEIILMEHIMPNGKKLGDFTKRDCVHLGALGARLAERLTGRQKVRDVLKEKQLRKIYRND